MHTMITCTFCLRSPLFKLLRWSLLIKVIVPGHVTAAAAAAAAKSLRLCPTLCDPTDGSPPGSPVPGILQARTLEWGAITFSGSPHKKGKFGHRHMHRENTLGKRRQRLGCFQSQSFHQRLSANHQKLGERYETDFLSKPMDVTNHLDPRLLGTKTVRQKFLFFEPPSLLWQP